MADYVGGRIKRIRIQNFMTYDDVEIYPKKGLNLVVGLNGTGKSSIMCAICLVLAGKPQFTGRASQLSNFIKYGCREAKIEIELESKKSCVIQRKIKNETSEWYLNRSLSTHKKVENMVKKFNIDTNNLCQFLPQEKVVEFSRMDKKQRLENMLQAIGEPQLFELFNDLKDLHEKVSELEQNVRRSRTKKESTEVENERVLEEVQQQEHRTRLKQELDRLKIKKKILAYHKIYEEYEKLRRELKVHQRSLETLHKERDEAKTEEEGIYESYVEYSNKLQKLNSERNILMNKLMENSNALTRFHEQVENLKIEYENKLAERENQKMRSHDTKKLIEGLEKDLLNEIRICTDYSKKDQSNSQNLAELQAEISELYQVIEKASAEKNEVEYSVQKLKTQLTSLQDEQNKKLEILKRMDNHSYKAACWLLENRNRFKSNVYLPIMIEISIVYGEYTKYVENVIGFRDMIAFVCEDKQDCERLTDILKRQMKLTVNIVMSPDTPMSKYSEPPLAPEYRQCGMECFVTDLFSAPEPIVKYLCACYAIHRIPVSKSVIKSNHIEFILQKYPLIFSGNMRISSKRSRYGQKNLSVKNDSIVSKNLLVNNNEELQKRNVELQLQQLEDQLETRRVKLDEHNAHLAEKEKCQQRLREEKKILLDQRKKIEKLKFECLQKKNYYAKIAVAVDEELEEAKMIKTIQSINENREGVLSKLSSLVKDFLEVEKKIIKSKLKMNSVSRNLRLTKASNEDVYDRVKTAEIELQNISTAVCEKKDCATRLFNKIKDNLCMVGYKDEIEERINHVEAELNLIEDNESVVLDYYDRKQKIKAFKEEIDSFEDKLIELKGLIQEKKREWLDSLLQHIKNVNKKFSYYFRKLSCAGEISLDIPENSDDFSKYGLQIKLKFHSDDPLTELSPHRHSGGECSVAAILFILSLQELTDVPFRCIDEINQGMDSINERKIFKLISKSVGEDRCSQYFLLTPKLLTGLEYPDDVAIHIIFNSYYLTTKLNVKEHLKIHRQKKR